MRRPRSNRCATHCASSLASRVFSFSAVECSGLIEKVSRAGDSDAIEIIEPRQGLAVEWLLCRRLHSPPTKQPRIIMSSGQASMTSGMLARVVSLTVTDQVGMLKLSRSLT